MTLAARFHHSPTRSTAANLAIAHLNARSSLVFLQLATAAAFGVSVEDIRSSSRRNAKVAFARQSAMYLTHIMLGLNFSAVGLLFDRDRTTAAHACKLVEDRRDDPAIDRLLQQLEDACRHVALVAQPQAYS